MTTRLLIQNNSEIVEAVGASLHLSPQDSHYIKDVLRLSPGDQLVLVNPNTTAEMLVKVTSLGAQISVETISLSYPPALQSPVAALIYPLTKGDTLEWVLEKGCELGVPHFMIWQSERSIVRLGDTRDREKKIERWSKILRAACQQSHKNSLPRLSLFESLPPLLNEHSGSADTNLVCSLESNSLPISEHVSNRKRYTIAVGPEGDFSPNELSQLEQSGFLKSSLGPYRLRAETAAIAAVSMVVGICGFSTSQHAR